MLIIYVFVFIHIETHPIISMHGILLYSDVFFAPHQPSAASR